MTGGMRILFYLVSFLIPLAGFVIGAIFYSKPDALSKQVGKNCLIIATIMVVLPCICYCLLMGSFFATTPTYEAAYFFWMLNPAGV